ncbi:Glutathione synthase [Desulfurispirillum indicum S5]|uniref:glutathione synthase n=1 Tax=Desulfurispirillum indicum (strain ATCC BAA-1389 / DSM 22839 / S5) TaxID=653733 RepID=E6W5K7_DESIS|nr:glutathione synthase [Desulfurispirillum indicum]ADU66038.1 Glutathione synthase [Desulfurispirillum indicum S5]
MINEKDTLAIEYACIHGLLQLSPEATLRHAPLSVSPYTISQHLQHTMTTLTPVCNQLLHNLSRDHECLLDMHTPLADGDEFMAILLDIARSASSTQPASLHMFRNDFMVEEHEGVLWPKLVECNTISASFHGLMQRATQVHSHLAKLGHLPAILPQEPLAELCSGFQAALAIMGLPDPCILFVVQPHERNIFDQRLIQFAIESHLSVPVVRLSLTEIAREGVLRNGHLFVQGKPVAVAYFRSGYTPEDYPSQMAIDGRKLLEAADCIRTPDIFTHLAGTKLAQRALGKPEFLRNYLDATSIAPLLQVTKAMYHLDEIHPSGVPITDHVRRFPQNYVLKPQREGGGNNTYADDIPPALDALSDKRRQAHVLMEKIHAHTHTARLIVDGNAEDQLCISETGRYGMMVHDGTATLINRDIGYLVRTKAASNNEGGVCSGYACLNTLTLEAHP